MTTSDEPSLGACLDISQEAELRWAEGYPYSLGLMLISAIIPFFFFRWKGWL